MISEVDYIIVGAGSSGCVLAHELSKDRDVTIAVIESGPADRNFLIKMPRGIGKLLTPGNPHNSLYEVSRGGNRATELWMKGRTLGGSSSINGMVYVRGHPTDYDGWEAMGCAGWGWKDMLPCFIALEDHELGATSERGAGGPLRISMQPGTPLAEAVIEAAGQAGLPRTSDINSAYDDCMGYPPRTIWRGARQSAAVAFLRPAVARGNVHVMTDTDVERVTFDGRRATGVELRGKAGPRILRARREVILSAGALHSPKLLQLSGIGPAGLLQSHGIEVIADSPNVGRNLREHMGLEIKYRVTGGSLNEQFGGWRLIRNVLQYFLAKTGPMTFAASEFNGFLRSRPGLSRPDCQVMGGLYSMVRTDKGLSIDKEPGLTISGYFLHPQSQGEIRITSPDFRVAPYVNANYLDAEEDRIATIAMMRFFRKIAAQPALAPYIVREMVPGPAIETDDELLVDMLDRGASVYHVSGTCRMGSDAASVVDPELRVRGVTGLRIVDTSIFPDLVSGNTNAPAMATGMRASAMIRASRS